MARLVARNLGSWRSRLPRSSSDVLAALTLAYCVALPFDIVPGAFGRSVAFPFLMLLLSAWVVAVLRGGVAWSVDPRLLALAASLGVWCLVTTAWSVAPATSLVSAVSHLLQVITVAALSVSIPGRYLLVLTGLTHGTVVMAILVLLASPDPERAGRASIFGVDENITGMVLAIGFSAAIGASIALGRTRMSGLLLFEAALIAGAILKGGSRSAFVAVALTLFALTIFLMLGLKGLGWRRRTGLMAVVAAIPVVLFVGLNALGLVPERIVALVTSPFSQDDSLRGEITRQYLRTMDVWIWRGVGFGADDEYLLSTGEGVQNVHQTFWRVWVEVGVVGLVLFCLLLVGVFVATVKRRTALLQTILLVVPLAFTSLTLGGIDRTTNFWFVVAFAVAGTGRPMKLRRSVVAQVGSLSAHANPGAGGQVEGSVVRRDGAL